MVLSLTALLGKSFMAYRKYENPWKMRRAEKNQVLTASKKCEQNLRNST